MISIAGVGSLSPSDDGPNERRGSTGFADPTKNGLFLELLLAPPLCHADLKQPKREIISMETNSESHPVLNANPRAPSPASVGSPRSEDSAFTGDVPQLYDQNLGPLLFEFAAADVAERLRNSVGAHGRVLEVACGTGICTAHLSRVLGDSVEIVATDLNSSMLDYARAKPNALSNVSYEEANAQALPYADDSFDAVVCQFGIMFFQDKVRAVTEMARVLRPGGSVVLNVWDSMAENRVVEIAQKTIATFFDGAPPRFLEVPFGFHAEEPIREILDTAGFSSVSLERVRAVVPYSAAAAARGLVEGNPGVADIDARASAPIEFVTKAVADRLAEVYGTSRPTFELQEIVVTGVKERL
jgi:ubiquinone/menaquinone biosynthesis C-methylase UbiE